MKLQTGIVTDKLLETAEFFKTVLEFEIKFESDWFILLHAKNRPDNELGLMLPNLPQVKHSVFQKQYQGAVIWLILESPNIEKEFERIKKLGIPFLMELTMEDWGDEHFVIIDPNGIGIDIVKER